MDGVLYYGDNLDILSEHLRTNTVDLIYLDPPFNSQRAYNLLFKSPTGTPAKAQVRAFEDMWEWTPKVHAEFERLTSKGGLPGRMVQVLTSLRNIIGDNAMMAYVVMMAPRLLQCRRVLKPTGSLYLHCDPAAGHYLKLLLDAVMGEGNFRNEIVWKRTNAHNSAQRFGPVHDVLYYYALSDNPVWNTQFQPYDESYRKKFSQIDEVTGERFQGVTLTGPATRKGPSGQPWRGFDPTTKGRHWQPASYLYQKYRTLTGNDLADYPLLERLDKLDEVGLIYWPKKVGGQPRYKFYLSDARGVPMMDVWGDIDAVNSQAKERIGYPTQKPLALLERIIKASSNPGDVVLDPFCGCGTAIDAAQRLKRRWIGIDVSMLAVDIIERRIRRVYGSNVVYDTDGKPRDMPGATALFTRNPLDFERWAVSLMDGEPNKKQTGDRGIDGRIRFPVAKDQLKELLISVKGGKTVTPAMVREIAGAVDADKKAAMGVLVVRRAPIAGMVKAAAKYGTYEWPVTRQAFPKIQIVTVEQLLEGTRPVTPPALAPYDRSTAFVDSQLELLPTSQLPDRRRRRKSGKKKVPQEGASAPINLGLPSVLTEIALKGKRKEASGGSAKKASSKKRRGASLKAVKSTAKSSKRQSKGKKAESSGRRDKAAKG